ncbi:DNA mismatch repair protein [Rothia sp. HMSC071B01]|uniref:DNA mismatch repair protein n=1 Tax=Rothia sp. HMSC071B01 TaxID=1715007 RepID=UPI0008A17323|nr:DNA mismatch repair protein [Rothia sp. HMSC071B01]OFN74542.1 DNA mismatch repair protein [Rothia sp. HMSC071B01]
MSFTNIAYDYEPEFGNSAPSRDNGITHPDPVLLSSMTKAQRGAVCRYLARFAELDDAKIFYAYGHADELAAKEAARTGSFAAV